MKKVEETRIPWSALRMSAVVVVLLGLVAGSAAAGDEVLVTIRADCTVYPSGPVVINAPASPSGTAEGVTTVRWALAPEVAGVAKIVPKSEEALDAGDRGRGRRIRGLFFGPGESTAINVTRGAGISRKPNRPWDVGFRNGEIRFGYSVEIPGVCSKDPQVCVRQQGSSGCST